MEYLLHTTFNEQERKLGLLFRGIKLHTQIPVGSA
jgi:hypothetical protein